MAKKNDILKLRTATADQMQEKIVELKKTLMNLRFGLATGKLSNVSEIKKVRRDIARLKTFQTEAKKQNIKEGAK